MVLFSTLLSASTSISTSASASSESKSSKHSSNEIPTLIQLFTTKAIILDENAKIPLDDHAILSYQALEVNPPSPDGESKLFQQRNRQQQQQRQRNSIIVPNLGVWNCCISTSNSALSLPLVDALLKIPNMHLDGNVENDLAGDAIQNENDNMNRDMEKQTEVHSPKALVAHPHFCFTVDLSEPSLVEPSMALMHDALVRLLIQQTPGRRKPDTTLPHDSDTPTSATTSLAQFKTTQFGLAPDSKPTITHIEENDDQVHISLVICAILDQSVTTTATATSSASASKNHDEYTQTQAHNLIIYHLRRYAAALNCCLCFVGNNTGMDIPTVPLADVPYTWMEWIATPTRIDAMSNVFSPNHHQPDLIESVLLRNAQHLAGQWDANKDSLWKALPPSQQDQASTTSNTSIKKKRGAGTRGDDAWMAQLRESVATVEATPISTPAKSNAEPVPKSEDAAVSSFFENLLKK